MSQIVEPSHRIVVREYTIGDINSGGIVVLNTAAKIISLAEDFAVIDRHARDVHRTVGRDVEDAKARIIWSPVSEVALHGQLVCTWTADVHVLRPLICVQDRQRTVQCDCPGSGTRQAEDNRAATRSIVRLLNRIAQAADVATTAVVRIINGRNEKQCYRRGSDRAAALTFDAEKASHQQQRIYPE